MTKKRNVLFFFLVFMINCCNAQAKISGASSDSVRISIECYKIHFSEKEIYFEGRIINLGQDTVYIPNRFVVGELNDIVTNIGYEILFCGEDTINITNEIRLNINPGPDIKADLKLGFLDSKTFKFGVLKSYLRYHGKFLIRCVLKRNSSWFKENKDIAELSSDWFSFYY